MGNNLEKIRGKHQLTQEALAEKIGMTKQAISLAERGRCSFSVASKVAEVLNENIFAILGSDALVLIPISEEEKEVLINTIKEL